MNTDFALDRRKLDALTSLRFFAAAMIVLLHGATRYIGPSWLTEFALAQGVSFFFVLSGFVLAYNYPSLPDRASVKRFYAARFARVWPLHVATMALMALFVAATWREIPASLFFPVTLAHITLTQAWIPFTSFLTPYNAVSWSLSVELFFYLLFPVLIANWERTRWVKAALALAAALAMWVLATGVAGVDPDLADRRRNLAYFHPLGRMLEFVLGIWACALYRQHGEALRARLSVAGATALEAAAVALAVASLWVSGQLAPWLDTQGAAARTAGTVIGTAGFSAIAWALLIWIFAVGKGVPARMLSTRPLIFLGEISYALYLVHMIFIRYREQNQAMFADLSPVQLFVLYWAFSLALSAALYIAVERPWRDIIRRWAEGRGEVRIAAGVRALVLVGGVAVLAFAVQPAPFAHPLPRNGAGLLASPVTFESGFRLDRVEVVASPQGHPELRFSWTALRDRPRDQQVAVHLLDADAKIARQVDHLLEKRAAAAKAGESWTSVSRAPYVDFRRVDAVGVGLYSTAGMERVAAAPGAATDWDGRRVVMRMRSSGNPAQEEDMKVAHGIRALAIAAGVTGLAELSLSEPANAQAPAPAKAAPKSTAAPKKLLTAPVAFESGVRLDALDVVRGDDGNPMLQFSWSATKDRARDQTVAVHLVDAKGQMAGQLDHPLAQGGKATKAGEKWTTRVSAIPADPKKVPNLGVALYVKDKLETVTTKNAKTDWGGKRVLVPVK